MLSSFLWSEGKIAVVNLSPAELHATVNGIPVTVRVCGEYPFGDEVTIEVETTAAFVLAVRIPKWAEAFVNGERVCRPPNGFYELSVSGNMTVQLWLKAQPKAVKRGKSVAFERGALVYCLNPAEKWVRVHGDVAGREFPHCDYEVYPDSEWQYAIVDTKAKFEGGKIDGCPFSPQKTPVRLKVTGAEFPWRIKDGCAYPVRGAKLGRERELTLIPYGATCLRITEFPLKQEKTT